MAEEPECKIRPETAISVEASAIPRDSLRCTAGAVLLQFADAVFLFVRAWRLWTRLFPAPDLLPAFLWLLLRRLRDLPMKAFWEWAIFLVFLVGELVRVLWNKVTGK